MAVAEQADQEVAKLKALVDAVALEMSVKLLIKRRQGFAGWDTPTPEVDANLRRMLREHVERLIAGDARQAIDVMNIAAMIWYRAYFLHDGNKQALDKSPSEPL